MHPQEPKRPRGRPVTVAATVNITLRLSTEHREKLKALGGADWVRARLDEAAEPLEPQSPRAPWVKTAA